MNTTVAVLVTSQHFTTTFGLEPNFQNNGWIVFQIVFYVCVIVFGILGNGLILHVYSTKSVTGGGTKKTSTFTLVKALAVSDLIVCLFRFRNLAYLHAALTDKPVSSAILYLEIPDKIAMAFTVGVTGVIAFDRYDCVCRPYSRLLNHRRALVAAVGCGVFAIVANAPLIVNILIPSFLPVFIALMIPVFQVVAFLIVLIMIIVGYAKVYHRIRQHVRVGVGEIEARPRVPPSPKIGAQLASALTSVNPTRGTELTVVSLSTVPCSSTSSSEVASPNTGPILLSDPPRPATTHNEAERPVVHPNRATVAWSSSTEEAVRDLRADVKGPSLTCRRPDRQRNWQSLQRKTTHMLFMTSVVFMLTWLPQAVYVGTKLAESGSSSNDGGPVSADAVFNLKPVLFLNNVVNPLIYGIANRRFRQACIDVLRKITC